NLISPIKVMGITPPTLLSRVTNARCTSLPHGLYIWRKLLRMPHCIASLTWLSVLFLHSLSCWVTPCILYATFGLSASLKMVLNVNKIKSILKKCQSFGRMRRSYSSLSSTCRDDVSVWDSHESSPASTQLVQADISDEAPKGFIVLYVGKSRRRYLMSAQYLNHPLLRVLARRCEGDNEEGFTVACEVVMFEHLVWMLDNAEPDAIHTDSLEELAQFYAST
ncbi:hypothetical protein KI387_040452, partial [Taxus chinensis]